MFRDKDDTVLKSRLKLKEDSAQINVTVSGDSISESRSNHLSFSIDRKTGKIMTEEEQSLPEIDFESRLYYPSLKRNRIRVGKSVLKENLFNLMFMTRSVLTQRQKIKERMDEILASIPELEELQKQKSELDTQYKGLREQVEVIIEDLVNNEPDISAAQMKEDYAGASYKKAADVYYPDTDNSLAAKNILHKWLLKNGNYRDGKFYIQVGDKEVESPVYPVVKVTPTIPS